MKKQYLALCTALIFTEGANMAFGAPTYDKSVNLKDIVLKNKDSISSGVHESYAVYSGKDTRQAIDLGDGRIDINLTTDYSGAAAYGLKIEDNLIHKLGIGTKITTLSTKTNNIGININGGGLIADKIEIFTSGVSDDDNQKNMTSGISASNSIIKLGTGSKIRNINKGDSPIWNFASGIYLENSTLSDTSNLSINSEGIAGGIILDNSTADLGDNSNISAGFMGVLLSGETSKFTANGIKITVDAKKRNTVDPSAGVHINQNGEVDLGSGSSIFTSGKESTGILLAGGQFKAKDLIISTTGTDSSAIAVSGGSKTTLTNSIISAAFSPAIEILGGSTTEVNLRGNTTVYSSNDAMLSSNRGNIKQEGYLNLIGDITAKSGGKINLNTQQNATSADSIVTGALKATGGKINWQGTNTIWNVTDTSSLNNLNLSQNSRIDFAHSQQYNSITVDNLAGSTYLNFKINFDQDKSDTFHVFGESKGAHSVGLVDDAKKKTNGTEKIDIIFTDDGQATFKANRDYEFGGYLYTVQRKNKDANSPIWEVAATGGKTPPAKISTSSVVGNYLLNLVELENLQTRMSTLRNNDNQHGAWARTYHGKLNSFSDKQLAGFDMNYSGVQVGLDGVLQKDESKTWLLGGSLNYTDSKQNYSEGKGKQKSYSAAIYATYFNTQNWYIDLYGKYANYRNKLNIKDSLNQQVSGKSDGRSFTTSAELGKRFYLSDSERRKIYIEPNAQLTISNIHTDTIKNSNGLSVKFDDHESVIGRVGTNIGYEFEGETPVTLYGKVDFAHEFKGKQQYYLNGNPESLSLANNWVEVGVGANVRIKENKNLFIELNGNKGNKFNKYDVNVGYRYTF